MSIYSDSKTNIFTINNFTLESGAIIPSCPIAYQTWGSLDSQRTNVIVVCHALSGSSNVEDWWYNIFGLGKALDPSKYFIFCANVLGSPYGSASPLTTNSATSRTYGPDFPITTPRDDVAAMKVVLDALNVARVYTVIGGSMGGMHVLEWSFYNDYVCNLIPIATSGKTSAWCLAWNETQRLTISLDPNYKNGYYDQVDQPCIGLAVARMNALLTYRSHESFEKRFGRNVLDKDFSAISYMNYQGSKFIKRFDANCYISITKKLDNHDISRGRGDYLQVLKEIKQNTLVIGIDSDGLYPTSEQEELAKYIPNSRLEILHSSKFSILSNS